MFETAKINEKPTKLKNCLIVALDVETAREAYEIIDEIGEETGAFKIGLQLFTSAGASFVRDIVARGHKIFLDLKFHDIPNTVAKASVEAARLGVWMFNVHALGGGEMMRRTVETVEEVCDKENLQKPLIIGVTVLTSANRETLREIGIESEINQQVLNLAKLAAKSGLDGVVASARETELIRRSIGNPVFKIVTPGIRPHFATNDDQKRVTTAKEAVANGSDYLVVGRPVLQSKDKLRAVKSILAEIEN
ncbi:MAG TPA: orotidine-5'-phosphate decarboxylase [Pyrinomonadaceae bacterium]|jgi:orotidine-5'-phosphate decarboxylase